MGLVLHMVKWRQASSCDSSAVFSVCILGHGPCMPIGSALLVVSGTVAAVDGAAAFLAAPRKYECYV